MAGGHVINEKFTDAQGRGAEHLPKTNLKIVEKYDIAKNEWTTLEELNEGRCMAAMFLVGKYLYCF